VCFRRCSGREGYDCSPFIYVDFQKSADYTGRGHCSPPPRIAANTCSSQRRKVDMKHSDTHNYFHLVEKAFRNNGYRAQTSSVLADSKICHF